MSNINLGNTIPRNGLVGEWLLDGNRLDTSGNGYNGTRSNVTYVKTTKGYQAQAGSFNGSSSAITGTTNSRTSGNIHLHIRLKTGTFSSTKIYYQKGSSNNLSFYRTGNGAGFIQLYNGTPAQNTSISCNLGNNTRYDIVYTQIGATGYCYINGQLYSSGTMQNGTSIDSNYYIGKWSGGSTYFFNGEIQTVREYSISKSQDEIQLLYLEGLRKLGPSNIRAYSKLMDGLVGYFENPTSTELWNIATGVKATYVGGTNTTDNLGINKAITNPNYTWSSITYTTGYTFENDGTGWVIKTSPSGLSSTGINRTTTLRNVFLFSRTLSADEVSTLQTLCNNDYIYPSPSYDLSSLREGLVLDLNEQGQDLSGNGNNGVIYGSQSIIRQGKAKNINWGVANETATNYTSITHNSSQNLTSSFTISTWIKNVTYPSGGAMNILGKVVVGSSGYMLYMDSNSFYIFGYGLTGSPSNGIPNPADGKIHNLLFRYNGSTIDGFLDGIKISTKAITGSITTNTVNLLINKYGNGQGGGLHGKHRIRNRTLSDKEIQALYYSQKANFVY